MKVSVFTLTSLFLSVTVARPHIKHVGSSIALHAYKPQSRYLMLRIASIKFSNTKLGEPLPEKHRMTAFIVEDGTPKVQCWEFDSQLNTFQVQRSDGTRATASSLSLDDGDLDSVRILTFQTHSNIWPPSGLSPAVWSAGVESGNLRR